MRRIAIQGMKGSFHDIASQRYFENEETELIFCNTFEDVFNEMKNDSNTAGMVAIENTIAGSLLHNYELLRDSGMQIVGEQKLRISHSLLCLPEDDIKDIKEINSHPVALMQCRDFLNNYPKVKIVEADDTAGAAQAISEGRLRGHAAICSKYVADMYGMKILAEGIETNKHNFTRFLVVCDQRKADFLRPLAETNKSSLVFSLPHEEGSLSQVLSILNFYKINLTKIQSLPIIGHEWEYMFYVDVTYNNLTRYRQSIDAIMPLTKELKILGEYKDGKQVD